MKRSWIVAGGLVIVLLVAAQFAIPAIAENQVKSRLTEGGGSAEVEVSAFPAERLLFGDGKQIAVRAQELDLELTQDSEVFSSLDGFGDVEVAIENSQVGPFAIEDFLLVREGNGPYRLTSSSTTTGAEVVEFGASQLGLPGAGVLGALAGAVDDATAELPVELSMELESDDGRIRVISGGGTVAGYPTGPLAELLTAAIVVQL